MTKRFNAFTLAEVLITLGIIGVVAAMTMPTLINQTNGAQYKAAYKKALSAISQGITLNVALDDKSFADASVGSTTDAPEDSIAGFLKSRMNVVNLTATAGYTPSSPATWTIPYGSTTVACTAENTANTEGNTSPCKGKDPGTNVTVPAGSVTPNLFMFFNDGSMFAFTGAAGSGSGATTGATGCTTGSICYGVIDVNGMKGPNKLVEDGSKPTDIYPVAFYDQTIKPASDAAAAVLYGK